METPKFDLFYNFIKNCSPQYVRRYNKIIYPYEEYIPIHNNVVYSFKNYDSKPPVFVNIHSPIEIFHLLQEMKEDVKDEILTIKSDLVAEEFVVFDAKIDLLVKKLSKLHFHRNYNLEFIESYMTKYNITPEVFATWHDIIDNDNLLYEILATGQWWLNPETFEDGIQDYPNLIHIEYQEFQAIQHLFDDFIKDQQVQDLKRYLNTLKIERDDKMSYYPFRKGSYLEMFLSYRKRYLKNNEDIDLRKEYSFLYYKLKEKQFIESLQRKDFINWLEEQKFVITNNDFKGENSLESLKNCKSKERQANFNNIFKLN